MNAKPTGTLEAFHCQLGKLLLWGRLFSITVVVMGSLFCLLTLSLFKAVHHPEIILKCQPFLLNYSELSQLEPAESSQNRHKHSTNARLNDPNWDGALAGAGLGFNLGQSVPFLGIIGGPLLGALLSYELDAKI